MNEKVHHFYMFHISPVNCILFQAFKKKNSCVPDMNQQCELLTK